MSRHITPSVLAGGVVKDPNAAPLPPKPAVKGPRLEVSLSKRRKWKRKHGIFAKSREDGVQDYSLPRNVTVVRVLPCLSQWRRCCWCCWRCWWQLALLK